MRILDYGAGKGRFAAALAERGPEHSSLFDFLAYNAPSHLEHENECRANLALLYPDDVDRRFLTDLSDSLARFDVVVMCNFLHEIPPVDWIRNFMAVDDILKEGGVLLLMEDQQPPIGELPHVEGYVVINLREARILFGGSETLLEFSIDPRLSAIEIPKDVLQQATPATLRVTLDAVIGRSLESIERLRTNGGEGNHHTGREHAFLCMLHTNASLARLAFP